MSRRARKVDRLAAEVLGAAAEEFRAWAVKALEGQVPNQRELARRLGWGQTTVSFALRGRFTFASWPKICRALDKDPIDLLARGRDRLREERQKARDAAFRRTMERDAAEEMISLWETLSPEGRARVVELLSADVEASIKAHA